MSSITAQARQLVTSRTYTYPILGISHFASHRSLWPALTSRLPWALLLTGGVLTFMFTMTYLPQVAVLAIFNGPLAFASAAGLVLSESSFIINLLARAFLIEHALIDIFDATLIDQNCTDLVKRGRELKSAQRPSPYARLGKLLVAPLNRFAPAQIAFYLLTLPLNFVPIIGTPLFLLCQGRMAGPRFHSRYFQLKGFNEEQRGAFVKSHRGAYTGFGFAATLLNLVPLAQIPFAFSDAVGAALWAAQLESAEKPVDGADVPGKDHDLVKRDERRQRQQTEGL